MRAKNPSIIVTEGQHPSMVSQCREAARNGAVFFWVRRHLLTKGVHWYIRAYCADPEVLMATVRPYRPTELRLMGDLWVCSFEDEHLHYLIAFLFPLQYRRLRAHTRWPARRGEGCFHKSVYIWGPLPLIGLSVVCLSCFKVANVSSLDRDELHHAVCGQRTPQSRSPVLDKE